MDYWVVETGFPEFTTFSVGEGLDRRTVVCFQQQLLDYTLGNIRWEKARDTGQFLDPPAASLAGQDGLMLAPAALAHHHDKLDTNFLTAATAPEAAPDQENVANEQLVQVPVSPPRSKPLRPGSRDARRGKKRPERAVYVPPMGRGGGRPLSATAMEFKPNSPGGHVLRSAEEEEELVTRDPGDTCDAEVVTPTRDVTDEVVTEITTALGGVQIEAPGVDYTSFQTSDSTINIDQFGHVIELYDFPQEMKTNDLMAAFNAFTSRWDIKWVDDTHALGVFSSAEVAAEALALRHPLIKSRPLNMATAQSKCKARAVIEYLLPYKPRPATSTAPARRLIQWALGSDKKVPAASRAEQERLREAMRKKEEDRRRRREETQGGEKRNKMSCGGDPDTER